MKWKKKKGRRCKEKGPSLYITCWSTIQILSVLSDRHDEWITDDDDEIIDGKVEIIYQPLACNVIAAPFKIAIPPVRRL